MHAKCDERVAEEELSGLLTKTEKNRNSYDERKKDDAFTNALHIIHTPNPHFENEFKDAAPTLLSN